MKKGHLLGLLTFIILTCAYAEGIDSSQIIYTKLLEKKKVDVDISYLGEQKQRSGSKNKWSVLAYGNVHKQEPEYFFAIFKNDTLIYEYSQISFNDIFNRFEWIDLNTKSPLIATVWQRGVHGEKFVLLDPLHQKVMYEITSSWPLHFSMCDMYLAIGIANDVDSQGNGTFEIHYVDENNSVNIIQVENFDEDTLCVYLNHKS